MNTNDVERMCAREELAKAISGAEIHEKTEAVHNTPLMNGVWYAGQGYFIQESEQKVYNPEHLESKEHLHCWWRCC
jgi:hypothetical protein